MVFKDLAGFEWAGEAIAELAAEGIVKGITEDGFGPEKPITRSDFLLLLMRTLGMEAEGPQDLLFADVGVDAYYANAVAKAAKLGIVKGDGRGLFHPAASIAREDMLVLTERALRAENRINEAADLSVLQAYGDRDEIADYAEESIAVLSKLGLAQGYANKMKPKIGANRAQAAMMVYKVWTSYK